MTNPLGRMKNGKKLSNKAWKRLAVSVKSNLQEKTEFINIIIFAQFQLFFGQLLTE